jgi:hypothetical protein
VANDGVCGVRSIVGTLQYVVPVGMGSVARSGCHGDILPPKEACTAVSLMRGVPALEFVCLSGRESPQRSLASGSSGVKMGSIRSSTDE